MNMLIKLTKLTLVATSAIGTVFALTDEFMVHGTALAVVSGITLYLLQTKKTGA